MVKAVRHYGYAIQGINPKKVPFPTPHAPKKVASFSCTPRNICWFGSAWAASYDISRTFTGSEQWLYLGRVSDGIKSGSVLFNDTTASPNTSYTYRIVPLSADLKPNYDAALELELSL